MSLLSDAYETCVILNKYTEADGYGGYSTEWHEGERFQAAIVIDSSSEVKVARASGAKNIYTVITPKHISLKMNDVFKRLSDEETFRVISDGKDRKTPQSAGLDMRAVTAEGFSTSEENGDG